MKYAALILAALCLASCTQDQRQLAAANAVKNGDAFILGYLTGGKAGALAGLTAQEIANIKERQKTAAKNPASVTP